MPQIESMKVYLPRNFTKEFIKIIIDNEMKDKNYEFYYDRRQISNIKIYLRFNTNSNN